MLFTPCRREILCFAYCKFNTGNYSEVTTQHGCSITAITCTTGLTACLHYGSNCTESICFNSIRLQKYIYTRGAELSGFDFGSICGTAFTRIVRIMLLLIRSSSIQFDSSTTVRGGAIGIKAVQFDSRLHNK